MLVGACVTQASGQYGVVRIGVAGSDEKEFRRLVRWRGCYRTGRFHFVEVLHGMVCDGRGHGCCGAGGRDGGHGIERWQGRSRAGCLRDPVGCEADARSALTISRGEWSVRATAGPRVVPFGSTSGGGNGSAGEPIAFDQSELRGKHLRRNGRAGVGGAVDRLNRSRGESAERCGVRGVRRVRCVLGESARLGL